MPEISEAELKNRQKTRQGGVFVLCGEEGYLIRHYRDRARAPFADDPAAAFNYAVIPYYSSADADYIVGTAAAPPMMRADGGKLVEITVESPDALSASDTDALIGALSDSSGYEGVTVLWCVTPGTLDLGTPKKRSDTYKKLVSADGVNVVYFPVTTAAQLRRWIERHFVHEGLAFDNDTADALLTISGTGMTALSNEIDKLTAYVKSHGGDRVTAADVGAVCCRVDSYDAFSLSNAILDGRQGDALDALDDERRRRTDPVVVSAGISRVITDILSVKLLAGKGASASEIASRLDMHAFKVKLYMRASRDRSVESIENALLCCSMADKQIKSSSGGYGALERLIAAIGTGR